MAQPLRNQEELQKQLVEFQELQRQLQITSSQRQQMELQVAEIKMAEEVLAKTDKGIYRVVGPILIESTKSDAVSDLKEKRELFELRSGTLSKQEQKIRPKLEELRASLEKTLRENKNPQ